ncbi:unnamed protein product [Rhodiola kirilowii]
MASADVEYRCFVGGLAWATDDQAWRKHSVSSAMFSNRRSSTTARLEDREDSDS